MDELATNSQGEKPRKTHYDVGLLFRKQQVKGSTPLTGSTFQAQIRPLTKWQGPLFLSNVHGLSTNFFSRHISEPQTTLVTGDKAALNRQ